MYFAPVFDAIFDTICDKKKPEKKPLLNNNSASFIFKWMIMVGILYICGNYMYTVRKGLADFAVCD